MKRPGFGRDLPLYAILAGFGAIWSAAAVAPWDRMDWALENLLVVSLVLALAGTYRIFRFSDLSYLCIGTFLTLHTVGAHYSYPEVPLGEWARDQLGWKRNHYDRLVHLGFGLLMTYPIRELLVRSAGMRGFWAYYIPINLVLGISAAYELLEWGAAAVLAPEAATAYLGAQGDAWDAQHDMLAGGLGAVLAMTATGLVLRGSANRDRPGGKP